MPRNAAPSSAGSSSVAVPDPTHETVTEHSRLHAAVDTIQSVLAFPPRQGSDLWTVTVTERLDALHAALAVHFAGEEARRLFEFIEEEKPGSAVVCRRLRGEHRRLLTEIGALRAELARTGKGRAPRRGWLRRARGFLAALNEHEERENALLLDAVERPESALD